jgi:hypothetical protein
MMGGSSIKLSPERSEGPPQFTVAGEQKNYRGSSPKVRDLQKLGA